MLNYRASGTVLGSVFLFGDLWVILVSRDVSIAGAGSAKYVVSLYTEGAMGWQEGTYFDFYPQALEGFSKKLAGRLDVALSHKSDESDNLAAVVDRSIFG
jgi:hypothetical protein